MVAWVITVAPMASGSRAGHLERVLAALALLAGLSAPVLIFVRPRLARHVGLTGFVAAALLVWLASSLGGGLAMPETDRVRALLGAVAWALYALSWSHPYDVPLGKLAQDTDAVEATSLPPRRRLPPLALGVTLGGTAAAAICLALAWRISDPSRAVLGHVIAVAAAVALLAAASTVAVLTTRARRVRSIIWAQPRTVMRPLLRSIVVLVAVGSVVLVLLLGRC